MSDQGQAVKTRLDEGAVAIFGANLIGTLLYPGDPRYEDARHIWNGMIEKHPALIAQCQTPSDVKACLDFARMNNLVVSVRGCGHNVAGTALNDGGLVIDLTPMKSVKVDVENRRAWAEPGLQLGEFDKACDPYGLHTTGGFISTTGVAGLTVGGGLGWLMRSYGLTLDNLCSVDVVTADGRFVHADEKQNEDLFWGVRGGGGNFGVVTSFEFELHPMPNQLMAGMVMWQFDKTRDVLEFYREWIKGFPNEMMAAVGLLTPPGIGKVMSVPVCYNGPLDVGLEMCRPIREFGPPAADTVRPMRYPEIQQMFDIGFPDGLRNYWKSAFLKEISDGAIDTTIEHFAKVPSPNSMVFMEHLGGAVQDVPKDATAFNYRDAEFNFLIMSIWKEPADDQPNMDWCSDLFDAMDPYTHNAVYVNYLGNEGTERVKAAYGEEKYNRLVALKDKYDPTNVFRFNQNIKPTSEHRDKAAIGSPQENKDVVRAAIEQGINSHDADALDQFFAPDVVDHIAQSLPGMAAWREGAKMYYRGLFHAFPDLHVQIEDMIAEGDKVGVRAVSGGTNKGSLGGIPYTGRPAYWPGIFAYRVVDGKIVEQWATENRMALMAQLGVVPAPPGSGPGGEGSGVPTSQGPPVSAAEMRKIGHDFVYEILNKQDLARLDEVFDANLIYHDHIFPGLGDDLEGLKRAFGLLFQTFPDMSFEVDDVIIQGDKLMERVTGHGTQTGAFQQLPPTGRRIVYQGVNIVRFAGNKIVERWGQFDVVGMLMQLGVISTAHAG